MADLVFPGQDAGTALNADAMPANKNLVIYKGDYVELFVTVKDNAGVAINLTGYTARASLKTTYSDSSPVSFSCSIPTPTNGIVRIYLSSTASAALAAVEYIWDFEILNSTSDSRTYLTGDVVVYPQVTTS